MSSNIQNIDLRELNSSQTGGRKASRIELRTLRDAYNLSPTEPPVPSEKHEPHTKLKRVTAYCTADSYDLKSLYKIVKSNGLSEKIQMYFGECLYASLKINSNIEENDQIKHDIYFLNYGVVVMWGMEEIEEQKVLKMISKTEVNPYDCRAVEIENFLYGIAEDSQIVNDKIFLKDENVYTKMVLSIAIAQSVKLDYFEELVDVTISTVKDLPDEVEKDGKVGKTRQELLKIIGRLHKLSFNLNLVSNILDEPDFIWHFSAFSSLYETCLRYLDIKSRTELLNKRCEIIHGILEILSENITTHNSEKIEVTMTRLLGASLGFGAAQCVLLVILIYYIRK